MSILKAQKLQTRILWGYSVPIALLVLFGIVIGTTLKINNDIREEIVRTNSVIDNMRDTVIGSGRILRTARGAVIFPEKFATYEESYKQGVDLIKDSAPEAEEMIKNEKILKMWKEYLAELEQGEKMLAQVMNLVASGKVAQAKELVAQVRIGDLDKLAEEIIVAEGEVIQSVEERADFVGGIAMTIVIIGVLGGSAGTLLFGNMIAKAISDEVKKAINQITSSSAEIATSMEEQERTASLQAASVNETTTTMDELRASSHQSEEQAKSASQAAQEVLHLAENGNQSVEETVATMVDLKNKVAAIADQIVRLSEQTNQIGNISALVSDLSQQTNMLALNASVEAVRAGEHGKGFAVVAEEIRKLADQSRQSASNISNLVSDIQNAINTTVMVTDEGTKTVNAGMSITESTANAFAGVLEAINNVAMNNQQIVLNIRQQGKAVEQVLEAMDSINKGAQETAAGLTQVKAGTSQLSVTARELEAMV